MSQTVDQRPPVAVGHVRLLATDVATAERWLQSVGGVSGDPERPDNIIFDITPNPEGGTGISAGGFGHPTCLNNPDPAILPPVH